ncbi:hypothetical protein KAJ27_10945 [bacterium]|nr:hypothetical protein [bacterium]
MENISIQRFSRILQIVNELSHRCSSMEFIQEIIKLVHAEFSCQIVEVCTDNHDDFLSCCIKSEIIDSDFEYRKLSLFSQKDIKENDVTELAILKFIKNKIPISKNLVLLDELKNSKELMNCIDPDIKSFAVIPLSEENSFFGMLILKSNVEDSFSESDIQILENIRSIFDIAFFNRQKNSDRRERIKELSCLYKLSQLAAEPNLSLDDMFKEILEILPQSFKYVDNAYARIIIKGKIYQSDGFRDIENKLFSILLERNKEVGSVEVVYHTMYNDFYPRTFLEEESNLIEGVANQISIILEKRYSLEESKLLQEQIRHADRLATVGQLAAGVAHELNEPLSNILGFAQLAQNSSNVLPESTIMDLDKIVKASMHAREIVKKLVFFSRQMPQNRVDVNLNKLVDEGLYFLGSRCSKHGIELVIEPDLKILNVKADYNQLLQVLVNLVVNAVQAMPEGGKLTIKTGFLDNGVNLLVGDTGVGMDEEIINQIFIPFYTTKDVDQGTGLGLSVAHGIIASHGGRISVTSKIGEGSIFKVFIPFNGAERMEVDDEN